MARFDGKVCIVTGGARGIGAETAAMFVAEGGSVVIGDINVDGAEALARELGRRAVAATLDVTDPSSCSAAVGRAVDAFGSVDCLVNSAIKMAPAPLKDLRLEDWNLVVNVGLTGMFLMTQAAGRWWIEHEHKGSVVMLSSNAGVQPYGMSGAYSTVKAGIIMLAQHYAIEWARHGIRVNAVCPGHTETPLTAYLKDPEIRRGREAVTPLGRIAQPADIAHAILFLLSDAADYITATRLDVDAGLTKSVFNHMPGRKWD